MEPGREARHRGGSIVAGRERVGDRSAARDEAKPAVYTLTYGSSLILGYQFSSKLDDTYKDAKNSYVALEDGKNYETTFVPAKEPEGGGTGTMIKNERVEPASGLGAVGSGAP